MKTLIIIRGPSGTGKSTIARHLGGVQGINWFESDMWFTDDQGRYKFDASKLGIAHRWCHNSIEQALQEGHETVIVSNTFCPVRDMNGYLVLAAQYGYAVRIIRSPRPWDVLNMNARNKHSVPRMALDRQLARYVEHPDEEEWADMSIFMESH